MKVYISGPITHNKNYETDFKRAEKRLRHLGFLTANPTQLGPGHSWGYYMKHDIKMLLDCDAVYMLKGWRFSRGAKLEYRIAKALGLRIAHERQDALKVYCGLWGKKAQKKVK